MDFIENRTKNIAAMALDGLYERSKAISANTANALTPNYKRKIVSFEGSLQNVIKQENEKEQMKLQNDKIYQNKINNLANGGNGERLAFLNSDSSELFSIDVEADTYSDSDTNGNNVNIEKEMMDEARTGLQYQAVASLLSKSYSQLASVIKGQNS